MSSSSTSSSGRASDIASKSISDTLTDLQVHPEQGLTQADVDARRKKDGYNEIVEQKGHPVLKFLKHFWGPSAWMLEVIVIFSAVLKKYPDLAVVSGLLVVNAVVSFLQERRAQGVVEMLRKRLQVSARVLRDASWQIVPSRELVPGDIVRLRSGDIVPADMKLLAGDLIVDQSALTGESRTLTRNPMMWRHQGLSSARAKRTAWSF